MRKKGARINSVKVGWCGFRTTAKYVIERETDGIVALRVYARGHREKMLLVMYANVEQRRSTFYVEQNVCSSYRNPMSEGTTGMWWGIE